MAAERRRVATVAGWADDRLNLSYVGRRYLRKVFPDHWSFMLGEIALWSFVVLLVTGVFLSLWFTPSMAESTYEGSYAQLRGVPMSDAYASTLHITFDVRGGLLIRQIHHWAAMVFIAGDARPPDPGLRHGCVPQAARGHLADRRDDAAARRPRGVRGLLAARRPALGHRAEDRGRNSQGHSGGRDLSLLPRVRGRVPRQPTPFRGSTSCTCC